MSFRRCSQFRGCGKDLVSDVLDLISVKNWAGSWFLGLYYLDWINCSLCLKMQHSWIMLLTILLHQLHQRAQASFGLCLLFKFSVFCAQGSHVVMVECPIYLLSDLSFSRINGSCGWLGFPPCLSVFHVENLLQN